MACVTQTPEVTPAAVARHIVDDSATGGAGDAPWPTDLLQAVVTALHRVLVAAPAAAPNLLGCASAIAAASPSAVKVAAAHVLASQSCSILQQLQLLSLHPLVARS